MRLVGQPGKGKEPNIVVAFRLKEPRVNATYTLADLMQKLNWHVSQLDDFTLHWVVTNTHTHNKNFLEKFVADLRYSIGLLNKRPYMKTSQTGGLYGMNARMPLFTFGRHTFKAWLTALLSLYAENQVSAPR